MRHTFKGEILNQRMSYVLVYQSRKGFRSLHERCRALRKTCGSGRQWCEMSGKDAQADRAATRDKLVRAATDEFFAHGYQGASLRQICSQAGVTTGALYFFFKNKQDLLASVIEPLVSASLELLGPNGPYGPASSYAAGPVSHDYERESGVLHKITSEFFADRRIVSIVLANRDNMVIAEFLANACDLIKKNTRVHVTACTGNAESLDDFELNWLASTIVDAVLEVVANDDDPAVADRHITSLLGFIRLGADAFLPRRI